MCLNRATWYYCKCVHIKTLLYVLLTTTLTTHLAVSTFLLVYSLWYAFIPLAITLLAHVIGILAARRRSFRLFTVFMIYEGFFVLALTALAIWLLIVMEIKPSLSFFGRKCRDLNPWTGACDKEIREDTAIAGGAVVGIIALNVLVLWPALKNFFHYLRGTPKTNPSRAPSPPAVPVQVIPRAMPSAPPASESMRRPPNPENSASEPRPQLYTIYTPTAEPAQRIEFASPDQPGPSGNLYPRQEILKVNPIDYQEQFKGAHQHFEPPPPYM